MITVATGKVLTAAVRTIQVLWYVVALRSYETSQKTGLLICWAEHSERETELERDMKKDTCEWEIEVGGCRGGGTGNREREREREIVKENGKEKR